MNVYPPVWYCIDADDRLVEFNDGWTTFAEANDGQHLHPSQIQGRRLWDFIDDPTTNNLYHTMVQRLRKGGPAIHFQFRCDSPERRRLLAMEMTADFSGLVRFSVTCVCEEPSSTGTSLAALQPAAEHLVNMCGWCKRVQLPSGEWVDAEAAIQTLGIFSTVAPPGLTHGMCPECYASIMDSLDREQRKS
jgi:hypothetical protein